MKMFGIRRNKKKKKINGAPPGYFTNELHEFTFNTPEMRMGIEEPSKNKKKRHKGERSTQEKRYQRERERDIPLVGGKKPFRLGYSEADNHPLDEANAHNEWVLLLLLQPSLFLSLFFFFFYFSFLL